MKEAESGSTLNISLTCDCAVKASQSESGAIIVDIVDQEFKRDPGEPVQERSTDDPSVIQASRSPESLKAARDRMIALLAAASDRGVVQIKGADGEVLPSGRAAVSPTDASLQRDVETSFENLPCVSFDRFADNGDGLLQYDKIMSLRNQMEGSFGDDRLKAAESLIDAYLRVAFFEEAYATSLPYAEEGVNEMILTAALSRLGGAAGDVTLDIFKGYAHCHPAFELFNTARVARNGKEFAGDVSNPQPRCSGNAYAFSTRPDR